MAGEMAFLELGVEDTARGRAFYEGLFGWTFEPGPSEGWIIDAPGLRAGMHGGDAKASPYVFLAVDDMDAALERVRELGGEVEEMDVGRPRRPGALRALQALPRRPGLALRAARGAGSALSGSRPCQRCE